MLVIIVLQSPVKRAGLLEHSVVWSRVSRRLFVNISNMSTVDNIGCVYC